MQDLAKLAEGCPEAFEVCLSKRAALWVVQMVNWEHETWSLCQKKQVGPTPGNASTVKAK